MNLPVRMLFRTRLHSDCCVLSFSLALAAYAATASLIGSSSRKPLPNIREQQISCLGDATSSRSRHGVPRSSRAVFSMTTLNFLGYSDFCVETCLEHKQQKPDYCV